MAKAPDAFRTISEVAEALDTPTHVLRFWESKFTQVKPVKRAGGRRYYRPDDLALLGGIKILLHEQGMTIKAAQKTLRELGIKSVSKLYSDSLIDLDDGANVIDHDTAPPHPSRETPSTDTLPPDDLRQTDSASPASAQANVVALPRQATTRLPMPVAARPDPGPRVLGLAARAARTGIAHPQRLAPLLTRLDDLHRRMTVTQ
ncbi:MerR family transcriptional regulator [Loktanella sp. TSTF-M6]|uniref:MerR family transcriptional regulator n=1 Tax=Loktanella gaetbuli TaxID=2881335 RepID=A0ABS8BQV1_9RHOB|nr:MerR family transcriptional regulator [Loktanella gaetbuli]MCB5198108.1 MerR family transcriptional regulator [Loktanella gaetbuli]